MTGFEFPYGDKTVFAASHRKKKTKQVVKDIIHKMKIQDDKFNGIMHYLQKANLNLEGDWYTIKGKGFVETGPIENLILVEIK